MCTNVFFVVCLYANFKSLRNVLLTARPMIIHTLKIIGDLADNVLNEGTQTKRLCHECIRDYIDIAHGLFPIFVNDVSVCEELFAFFHIVLDVLKTQVIKASLTRYS